MKRLNELKIGDEAVIAQLPENNRRLMDIGLIKGTTVKCVLKSPLGNPAAYKIRGVVIAIRDEDAKNIEVEVRFHG